MKANRPRGRTAIASLDCMCCGRTCQVRLDKNGRAYSICVWPVADTGLKCGSTIKFSWKMTDQMTADYAKRRHNGGPQNDDTEAKYNTPQAAAPATREPEPETEPKSEWAEYGF